MQQTRIAMVIGNQNYIDAGCLANPVNDAKVMESALTSLGFVVERHCNLNTKEMGVEFSRFEDYMRNHLDNEDQKVDVSILFYAGHGFNIHGDNFLIPVDAEICHEAHAKWQATKLDDALKFMTKYSRTCIALIDACRNNPFATRLMREWPTAEGNARVTVPSKLGFAKMIPPRGCFVAFSTAPGSTALDGVAGSNSPFTKALSEAIRRTDLDISDILAIVKKDVQSSTMGKQEPWCHSSLSGKFYFSKSGAKIVSPTPPTFHMARGPYWASGIALAVAVAAMATTTALIVQQWGMGDRPIQRPEASDRSISTSAIPASPSASMCSDAAAERVRDEPHPNPVSSSSVTFGPGGPATNVTVNIDSGGVRGPCSSPSVAGISRNADVQPFTQLPVRSDAPTGTLGGKKATTPKRTNARTGKPNTPSQPTETNKFLEWLAK